MLQSIKNLVLKTLPPALILKLLKSKHIKSGDPELKLLQYLIPKGSESIDVGVYRGVYSSVMADSSVKVHAFEPHPENFDFSKKALPANKVILYPVALSNKVGEAELIIPVEHESAGSISKPFTGRNVNSFKVKTKKLDDFNFKNIGFIKIDAEGHEYEIIEGGRQTIKNNTPNLIVEIEQRHINRPIKEVFDEVLNMGYIGYYFFMGKIHPLEEFSLDQLQPKKFIGRHDHYVNNFIFVHSSREVNFPEGMAQAQDD